MILLKDYLPEYWEILKQRKIKHDIQSRGIHLSRNTRKDLWQRDSNLNAQTGDNGKANTESNEKLF